MNTLIKNNNSNTNSNKKNFLYVSVNPIINNINNNFNTKTNSNISNIGNNNIIFNDFYEIVYRWKNK